MPFELEETRRLEDVTELRVPALELVVLDGPSRGARAPVVGGVARLGSAEGSTLRLDDRAVSRMHCEVRVEGPRIVLRDLGSTNGTFVDAVRIRDADVPAGTVVRAGGSTFRIEAKGAPTVLALSEKTELGELLGASVPMRALYAVLERAAKTDTTVLVVGETGTGKDVAARSIHALSGRAKGPFVPVDCGAIPENLIESELFGHVRGAFTGAVANRRGAFEEAHGGTLFLDEIGEMPLAMQAKLLRALETRTIRRVGAPQPTSVDVRIVAATNRPLARAVNEGLFREDLYYRLAVVEVAMPALRARPEDIPVLAQRFYERLAGADKALPAAFVAQLRARAWPGNVRELRNHVERAVALGMVDADDAPPASSIAAPLPAGLESIVPLDRPLKDARDAWTSAFEVVYVRAMLERTGGNVTRAAERAGVSRRFLQRTIARLGLRAAGDDEDADE